MALHRSQTRYGMKVKLEMRFFHILPSYETELNPIMTSLVGNRTFLNSFQIGSLLDGMCHICTWLGEFNRLMQLNSDYICLQVNCFRFIQAFVLQLVIQVQFLQCHITSRCITYVLRHTQCDHVTYSSQCSVVKRDSYSGSHGCILSWLFLLPLQFVMEYSSSSYLVHNARIYVSGEPDYFWMVFDCQSGRIQDIGRDSAPIDQFGANRKQDCGGRRLLPGFHESHIHVSSIADLERLVNLR